jgi:hypothetical protein
MEVTNGCRFHELHGSALAEADLNAWIVLPHDFVDNKSRKQDVCRYWRQNLSRGIHSTAHRI